MLKIPNFGQTMTGAMIALVVCNMYLCYTGKKLQAENQATKTEIALIQSDNRNLSEQIKTANESLQHYREQVKELQNTVLVKMQQNEERTNELLAELENHKDWSDTAIPADVERLLNRAERKNSRTLSNTAENAPNLPTGAPLPNAKGASQNKQRAGDNAQ